MAKKNNTKSWWKKTKLFINKLNPASEDNKAIRDKKRIIQNEDSSTKEKKVAQVQQSALKRKRDEVSISDVHAKNTKDMQNRASKKHDDWKKMRSGKMKKEDFIKKYPNSGTARKSRGNR